MGCIFSEIEATRITSDWYLWMHHTIDKIPNIQSEKKYSWQKKHAENKTGSEKRYKSFRIKKRIIKKNMKHGIKLVTLIYLFSIILDSFLLAEDRIITSPLINLDEIKPSYEEQDTKNENISLNNELKTKKK